MKRIAKFAGIGCIGLIGLVVLIGVIGALSGPRTTSPTVVGPTAAPAAGATAAPAAKSQAATPTVAVMGKVGTQLQAGNWRLAFQSQDTAQVIGRSQFSRGAEAQGVFVILTMAATNLHNQTSTLNSWDFKMVSPSGTEFSASSEGGTSLIFDTSDAPKPLSFEQVQPGLTRRFRLVFDVNPETKLYTLRAAGMPFEVVLP